MDGGKKASFSQINIFVFALLLTAIPLIVSVSHISAPIKRARYNHDPLLLKITTCFMVN